MRLGGLAFALVVCVAGCGSRSALSLAERAASGGSGGSGAQGGSGALGGAGTFGGTGGVAASGGSGGVVLCPNLDLTGDPIGFSLAEPENLHTPRLAFERADGSRVGVVAPALAFGPPGPVAAHLRLAPLDPWDVWPGQLGSGAQSDFVVGIDQFALDRGTAENSLAIAWPAAPSPPAPVPQGLFFSASVPVSNGSPPSVESLALDGPESHLAEFVRAGVGAHLVGFVTANGDYHAFHVAFASDAAGTATQSYVGCAVTSIVSDAVAVPGGGFVFAFSSGRAWGECLLDYGIDGPAHWILGGFIGGPGGGYGPVPIEIDDPNDVVAMVRLAPRPNGAFLVWQYQGQNAIVPPEVMMTVLDAGGAPSGPPVPILDGAAASGPLAVASAGDRLILAWLDASDPNGYTIMLRVLDASGQTVAQRAYQPPGGFDFPDLQLLASPLGDQLLLGWSRYGSGAGQASEAFVTRFCLPTSP